MYLMHFLMLKNGKLVVRLYGNKTWSPLSSAVIRVGECDYLIDPAYYFRVNRAFSPKQNNECWGLFHEEGNERPKKLTIGADRFTGTANALQTLSESQYMKRKYNPQPPTMSPLVYVAASIIIGCIVIGFAIFYK